MTTSLPSPDPNGGQLPDLPDDQSDRERHVEEVLNADLPPLEPLADYRQVLDAWAVRHELTLDEVLERLDAHPDPVGKAWADRIRADPATFAAMSAAIADGLATVTDDEVADTDD